MEMGFKERHFTPRTCPAAAGGVCPVLESQNCGTDGHNSPFLNWQDDNGQNSQDFEASLLDSPEELELQSQDDSRHESDSEPGGFNEESGPTNSHTDGPNSEGEDPPGLGP